MMNRDMISESTKLSLEGKIRFPDVVKRCLENGCERYYADLVAQECVYYAANGENFRGKLPIPDAPAVADGFSAETVQATIRDVQQQKIGYVEFLHRVMRAGCASYTVHIRGRRAVYTGRDGDFHVEKFPDAK